MAISTLLDEFSIVDRNAEILRTMGHPIRLAILDMLGTKTEMSVTDIHTALDIEQAVASHHLRLLRSKNIVNTRKDGKHIYYTISEDKYGKIVRLLYQ